MKARMRMAALAEAHQREAEQDREQQHLQDLALREGADHGVGNDVQEEIDALLRLGLLGVAGDRLRVRPRRRRSPRPACTTLPTTRPITSAKVETISK